MHNLLGGEAVAIQWPGGRMVMDNKASGTWGHSINHGVEWGAVAWGARYCESLNKPKKQKILLLVCSLVCMALASPLRLCFCL